MLDKSVLSFLEENCFLQKDLNFEKHIEISGFKIHLRLEFSKLFPCEIPLVYILNFNELPMLPHVERNGKICLFQESTYVIDFHQPVEIVKAVIKKAIETLELGFSKQKGKEFAAEFLAYWRNFKHSIFSIVSANDIPRPLFVSKVRLNKSNYKTITIYANDEKHFKQFLQNFNVKKYSTNEYAFYLPTINVITPPRFDENITVELFIKNIEKSVTPETFDKFISFLKSSEPPLSIMLSMPDKNDRILCAAFILEPNDKEKKFNKNSKQKNNLKKKIPFVKNLTARKKFIFIKNQPIKRTSVQRFDSNYLLERSGASNLLIDKKILIIGGGSVGGFLSDLLRGSGVGTINIVDKDILKNENLHRHNLGIKYIGRNKAEALKEHLDDKYVTGKVIAHASDAFTGIESKFRDIDLMIDVSGDENLNRKNNFSFFNNTPLIFGWIEPLGLGYHIVSSNVGDKNGCLECLYTSDDGAFSPNKAMFSKPNQNIRRIYAGCCGSFSPYSNLEANQLANDLAKYAIEILSGQKHTNILKSYLGKRDVFLSEGFKLSKRANIFKTKK